MSASISQVAPTGVIRFWRVHVVKLAPAERRAFDQQNPGCWPAIVTGMVVEDFQGRWPPGRCMRTSLIQGVCLESMRVATLNSVYQLQGRGFVDFDIEVLPRDYAFAVGETMLRLGIVPPEINAGAGAVGGVQLH